MKRKLILLLSTSSILGACVVVEPPRRVVVESPRPVVVEPYYAASYISDSGLDMGTPVYVAAYPDYVFYHRYDPICDCIRIVRLVEFGGVRYWVDHTGRRIHEGRWEPARPSAHALHDYRDWSHQHRTEFHHTPPPRPAEPHHPPHATPPAPPPAPARPDVKPAPPAPGPVVQAPVPQPLLGPNGRPEKESHRRGENGAGIQKAAPTPKPDAAKPDYKESRHDRKPHGKEDPVGKDVRPPKPAPAVKPAPAPAPAPAAKTGDKPESKGDRDHGHGRDHRPSDKPEDGQK